MKTHPQQERPQAELSLQFHAIPLRALVSRVQASLLPHAIGKKSFIINEIDEDVYVMGDEDILAFLIGGLVGNAVSSTRGACIRIETASNDKNIQVVIRNKGSYTYSPKICSLTSMLSAARRLGGGISLKSEPGGGFSVALSIALAA